MHDLVLTAGCWSHVNIPVQISERRLESSLESVGRFCTGGDIPVE